MDRSNDKRSCSNYFLFRMASTNRDFNVSSYFTRFGKLETNAERLKFVYRDLKKYNLFPAVQKFGKDEKQSKAQREMGNRNFRAGDYTAAFGRYTEGLLLAKTGVELGLNYANRSTCLFKMARLRECLVDIDRAFANNYGGKLKASLLQRRKSVQDILRIQRPPIPYHDEIPTISPEDKDPHFPCARNCIVIEDDPEFGRHIVATRDIEIGEVLVVEEAHSSFLFNGLHTHCHHCLELCYNPIPCGSCAFLLYCSEVCKTNSYDSYHKYECPILGSLVQFDMTPTEILALRATLLAENPEELHDSVADERRYPVDELFHLAVVACYMQYFLKKLTKFFGSVPDKEAFTETLFRQLVTTSLHLVISTEELPLRPTPTGLGRSTIACSLYSFTGVFNHSCCNNVEGVFYGNTVVVKTLGTIKQGEQCYISYGVTFEDDPKPRREYLGHTRLLNCKCQACVNIRLFEEFVPKFEISMHRDLGIAACQMVAMMLKWSQPELEAVKESLVQLTGCIKRLEDKGSWGNAMQLQGFLSDCYKMLGNRRYL